MLSPAAGEIIFEGCDISKIPGHKIVSMGMAHVPEGRRVFAELSVYENLKLGAYTRKDKQEIAESLAKVYESFPRLEERKNQIAGTLSGGEQQMLAMGRALISHPKLLMLDEPSMGLAPVIVEQIFSLPGLGQMTLTGINQRDYPVVQGCVLFIAFIYVLVNLVTDLLYAYIDPRISYD